MSIKQRDSDGTVVERVLPAKVRLAWCISMGRNAGRGLDHAVLTIEDEHSRLQVLELELTAEQLGKLVASHSAVDCQVTWRTTRLGMRHESKTEEVPFELSYVNRERTLQAAKTTVKPFEIDGWEASAEDMLNPHNRVQAQRSHRGGRTVRTENVYRVVFHRWVPIETPAPPKVDPCTAPPVPLPERGHAYLTVVEIATSKIVRRIDVTGKSERAVDKVERGLLINMDTERYCVGREGLS